MKKLLCLMGGAMLILNIASAQGGTEKIKPLTIDARIPDIKFYNVLNYKDSVAHLSDFQGPQKKLVIFGFWNIHCTVCIAQFPHEEALQKKFKDNVQIVLVTRDSKERVTKFIKHWEDIHQLKLTMPIIVQDTALSRQYIKVVYSPQYSWFDRWNRLIAQTNEGFLNETNIRNSLKQINFIKNIMDSIAHAGLRDSLKQVKGN